MARTISCLRAPHRFKGALHCRSSLAQSQRQLSQVPESQSGRRHSRSASSVPFGHQRDRVCERDRVRDQREIQSETPQFLDHCSYLHSFADTRTSSRRTSSLFSFSSPLGLSRYFVAPTIPPCYIVVHCLLCCSIVVFCALLCFTPCTRLVRVLVGKIYHSDFWLRWSLYHFRHAGHPLSFPSAVHRQINLI